MKLITNKRSSRQPRFLRTLGNAAAVAGLILLLPATAVFAQEPDNSKTNQQDRAKGRVTADQQAENPADRDLAKKIRKSITDDKNLSTYAHNIKVIARGGTVTLRGPVRNADEKTALEAKAVEIAGAANVKNDLTVKEKSEN
jgi:hyperosmotically inducible periplasmic protein